MKPVILIAGPTASGKSGLAIQLALQTNGEVINADALQVYSDLKVISARPSTEEMQGIPHHLFGHVDGSHRYSTGQWLRQACRVITRAEAVDPAAAARVLGDDPQRLIRIVSVAQETGKPLSLWQSATRPIVPPGFWTSAVLLPPRDLLYERINARFDSMVERGGLDEIHALAARGLPSDLPVMRAIGAKTILAYLSGELSLEKGIDLAKRDTRRFAKRQMTWFRGQASDWPVIGTPFERKEFISQILSEL